MEISKEILLESFDLLTRKPDNLDPEKEAIHMIKLLNELSSDLKDYAFNKIEGIGGSGIVFSAKYKDYQTLRAIKIPRERIYDDKNNLVEVDPELEALSKLSHKNITRLYEAKSLPKGGFCVITEHVEDALPLDAYVIDLCCSSVCRSNGYVRNESLKKLAFIIYDIVDAIHYMHSVGKLVHFDIKPDNILVSKYHIPYVTDLGFARDMDKYERTELVEVGFTYKYAHKVLTDPHQGARISKTPLKAKNKIEASQVTPTLDLFAFGRTLQELLKNLEKEYSEEIYSNYLFNYLHLVACLCLDGRGAHDSSLSSDGDFISDTALGVDLSIFREKKFRGFADVLVVLQRLLSLRAIEDELPELDAWSSNTINVSDIGITSLTPRVKSVLEHPLFEKLYDEHQLGMLDAIFPTASHTRFQHSLGVYHATSQYILALYNDKDNPVFRVFFDRRNCSKLLLASLIHDIGQTSFGHELEEIDKEEFSHEEIGKYLIQHDKTIDVRSRTLQRIIEGTDHDNWGISIEELYKFVSNKSEDPLDGVLYDIFDGQIDADKLDYLIRDSIETRVRYGHGIDYNRFLRSLTTYSPPKGSAAIGKLRLAIKRKGAASAESFVFARYQLYQSLYWHHTFRAIKAMFLSGAHDIVVHLKQDFAKEKTLFSNPLRILYLAYVIGVPEKNLEMETSSKSKSSKLKSKLGEIEENPFQGKYRDNRTLNLFWNLAKDDKTKFLIQDVLNRNIYKRIFEIPLSKLQNREAYTNNDKRYQLEQKINDSIGNLLRKKIQDHSKVRASTVTDNVLERFEELNGMYRCFLIDYPTRGWASSGKSPAFVIDFKRRHFRALNYSDYTSIEKSRIWTDLQSELMEEIADFRVYCHPLMHPVLRKQVSSSEIFNAITEHLALKEV